MDILILVLATWRISSLLANEGGPGGMFQKIRDVFSMRADKYSVAITDGLTCTWCVSVWVGIFWTMLYFKTGAVWLALPFALSAGSILLEGFLDG